MVNLDTRAESSEPPAEFNPKRGSTLVLFLADDRRGAACHPEGGTTEGSASRLRPKVRILRKLSRCEPANSHEDCHPERRIQSFDVLRLRLRTGASSAAVSLRTAMKIVILSEGSSRLTC